MNQPQSPPRLPTWLLRKLAGGYQAESLEGDLLEGYANGRGALWYWLQVLAAIWARAVRVLRAHSLSFIGAQAVGYFAIRTVFYPAPAFNGLVREWHRAVTWSLGLNDFAYQVGRVVVTASHALFHVAAWTILGYLIGRIHAHFRKSALLLFFGLSITPHTYWVYSHKLANAIQYPTGGWLEQLTRPALFHLLDLVCLFLGGLWLADHGRRALSLPPRIDGTPNGT